MRGLAGFGFAVLLLCQMGVAEEGKFVPLYNGKDLSNWTVMGGKIDAWKADGEMLSCVQGGGGWLRTKEQYSDYILKLEFRLPKGGNSGVGLRFAPRGNPAHDGMEIQLLDDDDPQYANLKPAQYTGGIYYQAAAQKGHLKKVGEWNTLEITCRGPQVKVVLNGAVVNDVDVDQKTTAEGDYLPLSKRPKVGYIGLQCHDTRVDFRKIELQNLVKKTAKGVPYIDLVEGKGDVMPEGGSGLVTYTGWLADDGMEFENRADRNSALPINLEGYSLIRGWRDGIPGMKVGGIRKLILPAEMAYGVQRSNKIPPHAALVFYVELVSVKKGK